MAAIFPPKAQGGVPPGVDVINGYTPQHPVVGGEGPLYAAPDCTTIFTAEQINAISSEILAAVDMLGWSYNSSVVNNLGVVLRALMNGQGSGGIPTGGVEGQALVVDRNGAPVWGAPINGGNF
jgi:hypothetical protein